MEMIKKLWQKFYDFFLGGRSFKQLVRYLITGVGSFIFEYSLFYILFRTMGWHELVANTLAVFIAFWLNFMLNRYWSFESKTPLFKQLILYLGLFTFNMLFSNGFIVLATRWLSLSPLISKVMVMCLIVMWNFVLYKKVIFKNVK